mmetsp:Transcript_32633/g.76925  ORF Transcript_32633/g.76925 Transcript_32633/m.76925 type:complete len:601 (-) Transcript_32633:238-2040(-)
MSALYQHGTENTDGANMHSKFQSSTKRKPQHRHSPYVSTEKRMPVVSPSPKSQRNACDRKLETCTTRTTDDAINDGSESWRNHGKMFRANVLIADERNGGNAFTLSDTCSIERYYRVADRVFEQFLSSNIAERNELIESYLVGNRLFKFLSVVLPTHHQYFSLDPKLEELRNRSESQLMELLEYIEELEWMIDEMEYNRYILNDLIPSGQDSGNGGNKAAHGTRNISCDEGDPPGEVLDRFNTGKQGRCNTFTRTGTKSKSEIETGEEGFTDNDPYRKFEVGNVKTTVQSIEAYNQKQKQEQMLKERVAAVLTGGSNSDLSINNGRSIHSLSGGVTRSMSSISRYSDSNRLHPSPEKIEMDANMLLQEFPAPENRFISDDRTIQRVQPKSKHPGIPIVTPRKSSEHQHEEEKQSHYDTHIESFMSWDADTDFTPFNSFSSDTRDFEGFGKNGTHIDLLLEDPPSPKRRQEVKPKLFPKIKKPPVSYPRNIRAYAQDQVAQLPSLYEISKTDSYKLQPSSAMTGCSSNISLDDPELEGEAPVKTKIEERMERAMPSKRSQNERQATVSYGMPHRKDSSFREAHSQRKLLHQFRGCVRSLLD